MEIKECKNCKFRTEYEDVKNRGNYIHICGGGSSIAEEGGAYELWEVSVFDAKDCLMFRPKETPNKL